MKGVQKNTSLFLKVSLIGKELNPNISAMILNQILPSIQKIGIILKKFSNFFLLLGAFIGSVNFSRKSIRQRSKSLKFLGKALIMVLYEE